MAKPLSSDEIGKLLKQEAESPTKRVNKKAELLEFRLINNWFKLNHHLCTPDCEHRKHAANGRACWNPGCKDPRSVTDRGMMIVTEIKGQQVCRYCYLAGYLT